MAEMLAILATVFGGQNDIPVGRAAAILRVAATEALSHLHFLIKAATLLVADRSTLRYLVAAAYYRPRKGPYFFTQKSERVYL